MGGKLRFWSFIASIGALGLSFVFTVVMPLYAVGRLHRPLHRWADHLMQKSVSALLRLQPWLNLEANILSPKTETGVLFVSNHRSHLDVFILLSQIRGLRVLAKRDLYWIPFLNIMMWLMKQIPVSRNKLSDFWRAIDEVRHRLHLGERVHIFPELTRCQPGFVGLQTFSKAPFHAAFQEKVTIVPIVFHNTDAAWPKGQRAIFKRANIRVQSLDFVDSRNFSGSRELQRHVEGQLRKALAL